MSIAVEAVWERGVLTPKTRLDLPEKTTVQIVVEPATAAKIEDDPTGWKAIDRLIGLAHDDGGPTDVAENHDEYLYGRLRSR